MTTPHPNSGAADTISSLIIAIASYRRPAGLARLLDSIEKSGVKNSGELNVEILVVDNDAEGSARATASASKLRPSYVIEAEPGIAAARNRALLVAERYQAIVFVDDDEWVDPEWFSSLMSYAATSEAGVITGPVISDFAPGTPNWVLRGGFFQRRSYASGTLLNGAATNNTLLRVSSWLQAGQPIFDRTFSSTGGSDSAFFSLLHRGGVTIEFCAQAVVTEEVPLARLNLRWLTRRAFRNGVVSARLWRGHHSLVAIASKGVFSVVTGIFWCLGHLVVGRGLQARSYNRLLNGIGVLSELAGRRVDEYKRD